MTEDGNPQDPDELNVVVLSETECRTVLQWVNHLATTTSDVVAKEAIEALLLTVVGHLKWKRRDLDGMEMLPLSVWGVGAGIAHVVWGWQAEQPFRLIINPGGQPTRIHHLHPGAIPFLVGPIPPVLTFGSQIRFTGDPELNGYPLGVRIVFP